ncbi:MAG: 7TM domain-containing protein, partial [Salinivenus sp.]
ILTSTAERFASHLMEDGPAKAARVTLMTGVVIACSYAVMNLPVVGLTVLAFPEVLFLLVAFNLWLGRWVGIRLTEYARFRWLIDRQTTYASDLR